jgi:hypothetical protein
MRLYNLTPIGDGWGWGSRIIEVIAQTLSLVFIAPVVYAYNVTGNLLSKILP